MTITAQLQEVSIDESRLRDLFAVSPITLDASFWEALTALMSREQRQEKRGPESLEDATWEDAAFY
ncbi:MAG: hypothetical protein M3Q29_25795 [Chloroflexota bacterium]|nr:hypothetical protein [Chloroflexota bacterium]